MLAAGGWVPLVCDDARSNPTPERRRRPPLKLSGVEREALVERIERRTAPIAAALGIVFVLVVIGENLAQPGSALATAFVAIGWLLWVLFLVEFVFRAVVAPSTRRFLARNWWQIVFLVLPFLRFLHVVRLARLARAGRIVSSAVRGTRSAGATFRGRLGWLSIVHTVVILAASQLVFEFADVATYGDALYRTALASVAAEPMGLSSVVAKALDVVLALYSLVFFASAAAAFGAYFVERGNATAL